MKRLSYILILVACFFVMSLEVDAKTYKIKIVDSYANMRASTSTSSTLVESLEHNSIHYLVDTNKIGNWYKVQSSVTGKVGYISANYSVPFVDYQTGTTTPTQACEIEMYNAGFKDASYWPYLCFMKEKHSNWTFTPEIINIDFNTVVTNESACGNAYITPTFEYQKDNSCHNEYTDTWYPASKEAVAHYMDPRNFLSENFVFQFEYLSYSASMEANYHTVVTDIIDNTSFYTYHAGKGTNLAQIIHESGKQTNVSPTFIASRILQELGSGTSLYNLYSGATDGYAGYYNFYNWGVTDSCANTHGTTYCGLTSAVSYGWNSLHNAIKGGAEKIAASYIAVGQDTTYLQKYNVSPNDPSKLYIHQYMTNVKAPISEAKTSYTNLSNAGLLNNAYTFNVPVYLNMTGSIDTSGSGATGGTNTDTPSTLPAETIITNTGLKSEGTTVAGVAEGSQISDIVNALSSTAGQGNITVLDKDGRQITSGVLKTGDQIVIKTENGTVTKTVVIHGDTSGDGKISALDLLQVQQQILGMYGLHNEYSSAADTSGDGKISALDLLQVQQDILGMYKVVQ